MAQTNGRTTARDGASIAYSLHKGAGGKRIALIHSLAMDRSFWDRVVPALLPHADVLTIDCRGHGASDKPDMPYTVELFADDLARVMDQVGWTRAAVAGASMGGCVSIAFAAAFPERTDALGLIDTTAGYGAGASAAWEERAMKAKEGGMAALVPFQKTRWFGDAFREANPDVVDAAIKVFLANDVDAYVRTCRMLGACDETAALPGFRMPVRIVVGEEDYATPPAMAQAMAEAIPGARMSIIAGARHFTPLEVPGTIAEMLTALLAEVPAR
ncbi:alpha/beta fold hydrolase [Xanthobacter pseudotagetidis]|uniref:alpha/beta fold hydrolase n=1 Tax=Xanthobacter pseudotagetidis TaxID=3119911 RepID=UPI00372A9B78